MELVGLEPTAFRRATAALFQLSYSPKLVIGGHSNARELTILSWHQMQVH